MKKYGDHTNEYRAFYANGQILSVSQNSGQPCNANAVPDALIERYRGIDSPYYTIDFAELDNGEWKIIEAGDGGVSGLPEQLDIVRYYRGLYGVFRN